MGQLEREQLRAGDEIGTLGSPNARVPMSPARCEVAVCPAGRVAHWPRVSARPGPIKEFAEQLRPDDRVVLEATSNALAIARIRAHEKAVEIVNTRQLQAIASSKQKTDRHDAKTLAQLLAAGMLEHSW